MTKIGVLSDSHRSLTRLRAALEKLTDCSYIVHLGDHDSDMDGMGVPPQRLLSVQGNCDLFSSQPLSRIFEAEGVRVFLTHGHTYSVKYSLLGLCYKAAEVGARAALFGHTHEQTAVEDGGILLLNPGALESGEYAILTLDRGNVSYQLCML